MLQLAAFMCVGRRTDYPAVLKGLRTLREQFGYQFSDLRDAEGFEGFVDSPQFSEWTAD